MDLYRRTESEHVSGTVNLRVWLRQHMTPRGVNRAMVTLWREPYTTHYFTCVASCQDVSVRIAPASGEFEVTRIWW